MADDIDIANDRAQQYLDQALAAARRGDLGPFPIGFCHNCNGPVPVATLFCDNYCRDDYERRVARSAK